MTEGRRKLGIRARSCGLQSPPLKTLKPKKPENHKGIGIYLSFAFGRAASSFPAPINAPPIINRKCRRWLMSIKRVGCHSPPNYGFIKSPRETRGYICH